MFTVKSFEVLLRSFFLEDGLSQVFEIYGRDTRLLKNITFNYGSEFDFTSPFVLELVDNGTSILGKNDQLEIKISAHQSVIKVKILPLVVEDLSMSLQFDAADSFEVRGLIPPLTRQLELMADVNQITTSYKGLDNVCRGLSVSLDSQKPVLVDVVATNEVRISIKESITLTFALKFTNLLDQVQAIEIDQTLENFSQIFNDYKPVASRSVWENQAVTDLYILQDKLPNGFPYISAGLPWFATLFGRDSLITAEQLLGVSPLFAKNTLLALAYLQGTQVDKSRDEEVGKIIHEIRFSERCNVGDLPFGRYYGAIDGTLLYISLLKKYLCKTNDADVANYLKNSFLSAVSWLKTKLLDNKYVFYAANLKDEGEFGLKEKGWKDGSPIIHADGQNAPHPIALCEVQGYAFRALNDAIDIIKKFYLEFLPLQAELEILAKRLQIDFNQDFWVESLGTYALAMDGNGKLCEVVSSNPAHLLRTGIITDNTRYEKIAKTLLDPHQLNSGWGVRTLSIRELRYDALSYQLGGVWPHDTAEAIRGLRFIGLHDQAKELYDNIKDLALFFDGRLPELIAGHARDRSNRVDSYFLSCSPQAWAASIPFALEN